jgi:CRP/FNR family transcriptional regulator, cyclic AMP receptor protein
MHPDRIALLQGMPIFGAISEATLEFLVARAQPVHVPTGACFFHEGDSPTGMFVIEAGHVVVSRRRDGQEFVLQEFGPGDCFGEMALMDLHPRSASVHAVDDCQAIEIRPGDLHELFELDCAQFALIQMNMGREVCRRLRAADDSVFTMDPGTAGRRAVLMPRPPAADDGSPSNAPE